MFAAVPTGIVVASAGCRVRGCRVSGLIAGRVCQRADASQAFLPIPPPACPAVIITSAPRTGPRTSEADGGASKGFPDGLHAAVLWQVPHEVVGEMSDCGGPVIRVGGADAG
jgi:hypothetical protein